MADNSGLIKLGIVGAVAYYAYSQGWLSFLGIGAPATAGAPAAAAGTVGGSAAGAPTAPAIVGANSLDAIYVRLVAAAKAPAAGLNVDQWGWYLNNELTPLGKAAPDPLPVFQSAVANFDRSQKLTAAQYWGVMAPALKAQLGMSGLGLFGGLGAAMISRRVQ